MLKAADLFCGAGGSSTGAIASGKVDVVFALNHWNKAIESHSSNHPSTKHVCSPIEWIDPRRDVPPIDLLMASPECTHHSNARGGQPVDDQRRAGGWHVVSWAEALRPKWIVVENVREYLNWGPVGKGGKPLKSQRGQTFEAWAAAIRSLGYSLDWRLLNAADYGEATKRTRLFVIARRGHSKAPIPWPTPSHSKEAWRPAYEIIDWSRECPSIFTRKTPLAPKTMARIEVGVQRFCGEAAEPFIVKLRQNENAGRMSDPLNTITAGGRHYGVAQPFIVSYHGGVKATRNGTERQHSLFEPLPTIDTNPRYALAAPYLIDVNHGGPRRAHSTQEPLGAITAKRGKAMVLPFLTEYYGTGGARSVAEPLSTLTTKPRHGLTLVKLMEELGIVDIGFRMLDVDELAAAQGFPSGYYLSGNQADQIRQIGNAVCPGVMRAICTAIAG